MELKSKLKHLLSSKLIDLEIAKENEEISNKLQKDGCAVLEDFVEKKECDALIAEAKRLMENRPELIATESNGSDQRVYFIDEVAGAYKLTNETKLIDDWAKRFYKTRDLKYFQMLGHIVYKENNLASGSGWHRDSPFAHQFKFILYLNDVNLENGPFQYIKGSHKERDIFRYSKISGVPLSAYRIENSIMDKLIDEYFKQRLLTITGKAGTLLIADVKGLHRGMPLLAGERWATTRYYFNKKIPTHFSK